MAKKHISSKSKSHKKHRPSHHDKHKTHRHHSKYSDENIDENINVDDVDDFDPEYNDIEESEKIDNHRHRNKNYDDSAGSEEIRLGAKTRDRLKKKIVNWLDCDDKIKELNAKVKKYKDAKKQQEEIIINMITKLGMDEKKIDVHDDDDNLRGRVYRHKSITKGALKEDIIKEALMEAIRDEKKVDQLVKKIESRRPINERYYLKRTKGSKD